MRAHWFSPLFFAISLGALAAGCGSSTPDGGAGDGSASVDALLLDAAASDLLDDGASPSDLALGYDATPTPPDLFPADAGPAERCTAGGGAIEMSDCCLASGDFPNQCLIGACGCAPMSSHSVKVCACTKGRCFNGTSCVFPSH